MKTFVKWLAKKYMLSLVNDALKKAKEKADVEKYRSKTQDVVWVANKLLDALKDNEISKKECDDIIKSISELF